MQKAASRRAGRGNYVVCAKTLMLLAPLFLTARTQAQSTPTVPLGATADGFSFYSRGLMFVDAMKSGSLWYQTYYPEVNTVSMTPDGWPLSDATCIFFQLDVDTANDPAPAPTDVSGTYALAFDGKANLAPGEGNVTFTISNQSYNAAINRTTANLTIPATCHKLVIAFTGTSGNRFADGTSGGVRNVRLIRPGYPANTTQVITDAYKNGWQNYGVIRAMDYLSTNSNNPTYPATTEWANRHLPTDAQQIDTPTKKGGAWEYLIELANETNKDLWINIPIAASNDYVTQLATLLHNTLNSNLHIYYEYSNEVWNGGFGQYNYNLAAAQAEMNQSGNPLTYDLATNYHWNDEKNVLLTGRRYAQRTIEIGTIFKMIYGANAITGGTVRPILAWQVGNWEPRDQMAFIQHTYGAPNQSLYGFATAPYFGTDDSNTDTTAHLFAGLQANISGGIRQSVEQSTALATFYGLKNCAYEGGLGIDGNTNLGVKYAAARDPRMKDTMIQYLNTWYSGGGDLFMQFDLCGGWSQYGFWGATDNIYKTTPRNDAITQVVSSPRPAITTGRMIPAVIPAPNYTAGYYMDYGNPNPTPGATIGVTPYTQNTGTIFEYLLRSSSGGTHTISLQVTSTNFNGVKTNLTLDNVLLGSPTLPNGGTTAPITFTTTPGLHTLRISQPTGAFNLQTLTIRRQAIVSGVVMLPGCVNKQQNITFTFRPASGTNLTRTVTLNADGSFALNNIPDGVYTLAVQGSKWLRNVVPVDLSSGDAMNLAVTLTPGDANGDNVVDIADFGILVNAYGGDSAIAGSGYDVRSDFDCDGVVDIGDFGLLVNAYGTTGAN